MANPYEIAGDERERLILEFLPKVRWIAAGIHDRLPSGTSEEDLVSTGVLGLISAIDNYDPTRNASLWTYAEYKIRGAILDSVRELDGVPAHRRKQLKQLQEAIASAEQRLAAVPTDEDIAEELGLSLEQYRQTLFDVRGITLGSLDAPAHESGEAAIVRLIADPKAETPAQVFERRELQQLLTDGIDVMPQLERTILHLYFVEELTLQEIGTVVNLHYSRVSQIKAQAILRLRTYMERRTRTAPRKER